ncbi:unnamed protein product [Dovyalis caffra]|uniref:adenylate kinase n=1 Tax=Dovyalis caffra TaxID=77055 RepID=A0AAV1RLV7_9ROSI|nr:unnamed protein product [Dovyalis caffra]
MLRRVASLSPLISTSKSTSLDQAACGFKIWRSLLTTEASTLLQVKDGTASFKEKNPFITFVLGRFLIDLKCPNFSAHVRVTGGPGSGKGTQCQKIVETFGFKHLSAGELLRREIESNSEYWSQILDTIKEGRIVPSEVTVKLIQKEMESSDNCKFLIDGFPRTEENRIAFEQLDLVFCQMIFVLVVEHVIMLVLMQTGLEPNVVLFFDCPEEEMVKRVLNRNEGRVDDNIDTVKKRLKVFENLNLPVIDYYSKRGKLHRINAVGTEDEIFKQVRPIFSSCDYPCLYAFNPNTYSDKVKKLANLSFLKGVKFSAKGLLEFHRDEHFSALRIKLLSSLLVLLVQVHISRLFNPISQNYDHSTLTKKEHRGAKTRPETETFPPKPK